MAKQTSNRAAREPSLPDSELEVMRVLWKKERATAREVWGELKDVGSGWTYATVNTLLQRLEAKGLAGSDKSKMTYIYWPEISRQQVAKRRVKQIVEKLYDGKGVPLVVQLLKNQRLSTAEAAEIRQMLDAALTNHDSP